MFWVTGQDSHPGATVTLARFLDSLHRTEMLLLELLREEENSQMTPARDRLVAKLSLTIPLSH